MRAVHFPRFINNRLGIKELTDAQRRLRLRCVNKSKKNACIGGIGTLSIKLSLRVHLTIEKEAFFKI